MSESLRASERFRIAAASRTHPCLHQPNHYTCLTVHEVSDPNTFPSPVHEQMTFVLFLHLHDETWPGQTVSESAHSRQAAENRKKNAHDSIRPLAHSRRPPPTINIKTLFEKKKFLITNRSPSKLYLAKERRKKRNSSSCEWFRSIVLRVMSPARFRCATQLSFEVDDKILTHLENILKQIW